jgi:mannose-6-phosphate isomerase
LELRTLTARDVVDRTAADASAVGRSPLAQAAFDLDLWLRASALPLWATLGVDHQRSSFQEAIDLDGRPVDLPRRLRVQARQLYVFTNAGALGWPGPWRGIVEAGLAFMLQHYQRPDGAFRTLVDAAGSPLDETAVLYDHAFVLFALASCHRVGLHKARMRELAEQMLSGPLEAMRDGAGAFREPSAPITRQSNPNMHLLEAALAWEAETGSTRWSDLADGIIALALTRLIDPRSGAVHEFFGDAWGPASGEPGRVIEPGHQFEWCWLLERWGRARGRADAGAAAARLFDCGAKGVDPRRNVAVDSQFDDFSARASGARLWPQTEWLKASLILAARGDGRRSRYLDQAARAVLAIKAYLMTPVPGMWRDRLIADGAFIDEPSPASSFYHIVCALDELRAATAREA